MPDENNRISPSPDTPGLDPKAAALGYVFDPESGFHWHPYAEHWYQPAQDIYLDQDGAPLAAELAEAAVAESIARGDGIPDDEEDEAETTAEAALDAIMTPGPLLASTPLQGTSLGQSSSGAPSAPPAKAEPLESEPLSGQGAEQAPSLEEAEPLELEPIGGHGAEQAPSLEDAEPLELEPIGGHGAEQAPALEEAEPLELEPISGHGAEQAPSLEEAEPLELEPIGGHGAEQAPSLEEAEPLELEPIGGHGAEQAPSLEEAEPLELEPIGGHGAEQDAPPSLGLEGAPPAIPAAAEIPQAPAPLAPEWTPEPTAGPTAGDDGRFAPSGEGTFGSLNRGLRVVDDGTLREEEASPSLDDAPQLAGIYADPAEIPTRFSGSTRVVVHLLSGSVHRGTLEGADLLATSITLSLPQGSSEFSTETIKAVFFMREPDLLLPAPQGRRVRLTLSDGRILEGFAPDPLPSRGGFFLVPSDTRANTAWIYVYPHAIRDLSLA